MKIRALKTTYDNNYGSFPRGTIAEIDDHTARDLIAQGYAIEELPLAEQEAAPKSAGNDNSPFVQTGSRIGADPLQSLLRADHQQLAQDLSEDVGEQDSSPSTTDTRSALGQTPSTPATSTGGKRKRGRPRTRG
jgi:hypothetical protein